MNNENISASREQRIAERKLNPRQRLILLSIGAISVDALSAISYANGHKALGAAGLILSTVGAGAVIGHDVNQHESRTMPDSPTITEVITLEEAQEPSRVLQFSRSTVINNLTPDDAA